MERDTDYAANIKQCSSLNCKVKQCQEKIKMLHKTYLDIDGTGSFADAAPSGWLLKIQPFTVGVEESTP